LKKQIEELRVERDEAVSAQTETEIDYNNLKAMVYYHIINIFTNEISMMNSKENLLRIKRMRHQ